MELGFIGLGRMGLNMVTRLMGQGAHSIVCWDLSKDAVSAAASKGATPALSIEDLARKLKPERAIWIMVPSGKPVDDTIERLLPFLSPGDAIIDGGNSMYKDTVRRSMELSRKGIHLMDSGTSGGIWGLKNGYCLMVGGDEKTFKRLEPIFKTLAPENGYAYMGGSGSGHYVKMIHNGIEYGMLQAYAEGFALMHASAYGLDLKKITGVWNNGSVVRSWLLELLDNVYAENKGLEGIKAFVEDSGEGRWTVLDSLDKDVPCPVMTLSLLQRFESRQKGDSYSAKVISALRHEFGGHKITK